MGYPGESEADFQATIDLVERVAFDSLFVFMYSPRPGTAALRLGDDVPEAEKKRRLQVLNVRQQRPQSGRNAGRVGTDEEVLVESAEAEGRLSGRSQHFRIVHFDGDASLVGQLVTVRVAAAGPNALQGSVVAQPTH